MGWLATIISCMYKRNCSCVASLSCSNTLVTLRYPLEMLYTQGRIYHGANGAAAPGPHQNRGPHYKEEKVRFILLKWTWLSIYEHAIIPEQFTAIGPPSFIWRGGGGAKKIVVEHFSQITQHRWANISISNTSQLTQYCWASIIISNPFPS